MLKYGLLTLIFLTATAIAGENDRPPNDRTPLPADARYQLSQSPILARLTFKLDTWTGTVWQFVSGKDRSDAWELMKVVSPAVTSEARALAGPRFQIFL